METRQVDDTQDGSAVASATALPPTAEAIEAAISLLRKGSRAAQERAVAMLEDVGPAGIERLLAEVKDEADKRRERRKPWRVVRTSLLALLAYVAIIVCLQLTPLRHWPGAGGLSNAFAIAIVSSLALSRFQINAGKALAHLGDVRAVGQLSELLEGSDRKTRRLVVDALTRLLPRLQPEQKDLLDEQHRARLGRAIARSGEPAFAEAAIRALDTIGDHSCASIVKRIASGDARSSKHVGARAAALDALPRFERRAERARLASTLLRPADAPTDDALLRPASGPDTTPEETLLRPADGE
jgi:hypothetical protein